MQKDKLCLWDCEQATTDQTAQVPATGMAHIKIPEFNRLCHSYVCGLCSQSHPLDHSLDDIPYPEGQFYHINASKSLPPPVPISWDQNLGRAHAEQVFPAGSTTMWT